MLSTRVVIGLYLLQEHQRAFPTLLVSFSESDDSFLGSFPGVYYRFFGSRILAIFSLGF